MHTYNLWLKRQCTSLHWSCSTCHVLIILPVDEKFIVICTSNCITATCVVIENRICTLQCTLSLSNCIYVLLHCTMETNVWHRLTLDKLMQYLSTTFFAFLTVSVRYRLYKLVKLWQWVLYFLIFYSRRWRRWCFMRDSSRSSSSFIILVTSFCQCNLPCRWLCVYTYFSTVTFALHYAIVIHGAISFIVVVVDVDAVIVVTFDIILIFIIIFVVTYNLHPHTTLRIDKLWLKCSRYL